MAVLDVKLTKRAVDAAEPDRRRKIVWDSELKGFGLVVQPSGTKSYVVRYYTPSGRDRRLTLGRHGELTPDQARKLAADTLAGVRSGLDPLEEKEPARQASTVSELVGVYRARHLQKRKPATQTDLCSVIMN